MLQKCSKLKFFNPLVSKNLVGLYLSEPNKHTTNINYCKLFTNPKFNYIPVYSPLQWYFVWPTVGWNDFVLFLDFQNWAHCCQSDIFRSSLPKNRRAAKLSQFFVGPQSWKNLVLPIIKANIFVLLSLQFVSGATVKNGQLSLRCGPGQTCGLACLCSAWSASVY